MLKQLYNALIPHKGEVALQLSELRYRRLFETAQDGILILDGISGKIIDANPFLKEILGYSQEELLGKQLWQIGVFKDIAESKKTFQELQSRKYIRYKDLPLLTKDGKAIEVEFVSNVYMVGIQQVIQCNIRDITERLKVEDLAVSRTAELEQLNKSQSETKKAMLNVMEDLAEAKVLVEIEKVRGEAIFASIGEGLIAVDNNRKITLVNKAAEVMLGWKINDLIGKVITTLPLEDEQGQLMPLDKRPTYIALSTSKSVTNTYFFVKKDKTKFPMMINVTPIKIGGKTIGLIETMRDITREREVDKAKSEFVSLASHQLRTPLGIIKWYLEALAQEDYFKKSPTIIRDYVDEIYKSNERVLSLMRDLLSVSRIDQGRVKNMPKSVNIYQLIKGIVEQMQIMANNKGVVLHLTTQGRTTTTTYIDVLRFHEVIENLLTNAIEYTHVPGSVEVKVGRVQNILLISVKDTGIGISAKDQKNLFTKFFRSEKATEHNPEGSGLGLYVAKSYVEGWGGKNYSGQSRR